jgi:hypothetical protein
MKKSIKKSAGGKKAIKASALLALLFAGNVAKGLADEITGAILFGPSLGTSKEFGGMYSEYDLDTMDNLVEDMYMRIPLKDKTGDMAVYSTLLKYLKEGRKIIFENEGLKQFDTFRNDRMYGFIIDDRSIELTQLFSLDVIKREFPYLYAKLLREGRAK